MILKKWIVAMLPLGIVLSCTRNEMEKLPIPAEAKLETDTVFRALVKDHLDHYASIRDVAGIQTVAKDGVITEEEFREYWRYFGMTGPLEMQQYYERMRSRVADLDKRFHFSKMSADEKNAVVLNRIKESWGLPDDTASNARLVLDDNCERIRLNCLAQVMSQTMLMHINCATMDVTVLLGIACHAAVTIYQIAASSTCNMDYQKCKGRNTPEE